MRDAFVALGGVGALIALQAYALSLGIDGLALAGTTGAVTAILGYYFGLRKGRKGK